MPGKTVREINYRTRVVFAKPRVVCRRLGKMARTGSQPTIQNSALVLQMGEEQVNHLSLGIYLATK